MRDWDRYWFLHSHRNESVYRYRDWLGNADRVGTWDRHRDRVRYRNRDIPLDRDWVGMRDRNGNLVRHCESAGATAVTYSSSVQGPAACPQSNGWATCIPKAQTGPVLFSKDPALFLLLWLL
jgi:hypothetical protein